MPLLDPADLEPLGSLRERTMVGADAHPRVVRGLDQPHVALHALRTEIGDRLPDVRVPVPHPHPHREPLTIGVQAILIELSSPGGWIAGFIGVVCLALAIYHEAGTEDRSVQLGIAQVALNRLQTAFYTDPLNAAIKAMGLE